MRKLLMRSSRAPASACAALLVVAASASLDGCYRNNLGSPPDDNALYFPVGIALTASGDHLFVVNSDFDLRFNAGTLLTLDAAKIATLARQCAHPPKEGPSSGCDPAKGLPVGEVSLRSIRIGAFSSDVLAVQRYDSGGHTKGPTSGRLLLPVRGDGAVTYVDYDENPGKADKGTRSAGPIVVSCGEQTRSQAFGGYCDAAHRLGNDANADSRNIVIDGTPFAIAASGGIEKFDVAIGHNPPDDIGRPNGIGGGGDAGAGGIAHGLGGVVVLADQATGNVSLFVDALREGGAPALAYTLTGLPANATSIVPIEFPSATSTTNDSYVPRFVVANRSQAALNVVNVLPDDHNAQRSALTLGDPIAITTNAGGTDTRAVVVDPPRAGERRNTRIFLSGRTPASIVAGEIDPLTGQVSFYDSAPLPVGPSRLIRSATTRADGTLHTRLYATSFDARTVLSFDPDARRIGSVIRTGRGPYALVEDANAHLAYVVNFIDMTIQVIELDPLATSTYEQIIFTVGVPAGPRR